ncbi:MAG: SusC/RagA family TonB-linked outer membrane protein [Bacteroidales bacterium]|nr:SusC/RagA family TonB-linked outer membrane protein [Bacteroidales bacterium]
MKKFKLLLACLLMAVSTALFAQNRQISGTVTDQNGEPVAGAYVLVKDTNVGATTDFNGAFRLSGVPASSSTLVISFMGMKTVEVPVAAQVSVVLESESEYLQETVVTALGITKSQKAIGYAATTVRNEDITASRNNDAVSALAGKVAGMQVSNSSTTAGAAQSVIIRGVSSIGRSNQPLYVIDGIPLQSVTVYNTQSGYGNLGAGIGSINSDDIETMTVLKGAAATALYGSRASGGVIVINTKSGKGKNRTQVTVNAGVQFSSVSTLPEFQDKWGTGWNGELTLDENGSWGPILNGQIREYGPIVNNSQMIKSFIAIPNNIRNFYETGVQYNTSVALQGGNETTGYYVSYSNVTDDGILPYDKDTYKKNTLSFRGNHQAYKWLSLESSINLTTQATDQVGQGSQNTSIIEGLYQSGRDISFIDAKDLTNVFNTPAGWYTPYGITNPYWLIENAYNHTDMKKVFGKVQANITPIQQLTLSYRYGFDYTDFDRKLTEAQIALPSTNPNASSTNMEGTVVASYGRYYETNHDFLANWSDQYVGGRLDINATVGANINERYSTTEAAQVTGLTFDTGFWDLSNTSKQPTASESQSKRRGVAIFGDFQFGWDDQVYLDITARNDWTSTLPIKNNSYFYPGATLSWLLTNTFDLSSTPLSFGKLRLAYGKTGNDPNVYQTTATYAQGSSGGYFGAGTALSFPFGGYNAFMKSATLASDSLQPEMTTEFEVGADLRFFNDRIGIDAAYYDRVSDMQIFSLPVDPATGYNTMVMNFGKVSNKGVELLLTTTPVRTRDFKWTVDFNWSKNHNKVVSLPEGLDGGKASITRDGWGDIYMYAEVGKPIGQLYATLPVKTDEGQFICDPKTGLPKQSSDLQDTGYNVQNDWVGGISTGLTYKNVSVSATLDIRHGGKIYSRTKSLLWFTGNSIETTYNERRAFIVPNSVLEDGNGGYVENTVPIDLYSGTFQYYFDGNTSNPIEGSACTLIDRSYTKLRNLTISYTLPEKWLKPVGIKGATLSAVGNNLFVWTPSSNPYIDPDQGFTTDLTGMLGEYFCTVPCRYLGFNVKVIF